MIDKVLGFIVEKLDTKLQMQFQGSEPHAVTVDARHETKLAEYLCHRADLLLRA